MQIFCLKKPTFLYNFIQTLAYLQKKNYLCPRNIFNRKRNMKKLTFFILLSAVLLMITGCSLFKNEPNEVNASDLIGTWYRTYSNDSGAQCLETWIFKSDNSGEFSDNNKSKPIHFTFDWTLNNKKLSISNTGGSFDMKIEKLNADELNLILDNQRYSYTHTKPANAGGDEQQSGDEDDPSTNYAPSNVKNYEFTFTTSFVHYIYFTSNSSINTSNSYISHYPDNYKITSASYTKTSNNKATITYSYSKDGQARTETVYLTFTSASSGKLKTTDGILDYNFSCKYLGSGENISAPSSIAYKKFTVGYGYTWYQFGADNGYRISITSASKTYETQYATYSKNTSTTATLKIHENFSSYTSLITTTYNLTFMTATSGTYSRTSTSSYDNKTTTGNFTLE